MQGKEGIHHFFHTFLRVLGTASETTIRNWIVGQLDCFHMTSRPPCWCAIPFLWEFFFFFPICIAAGHVGKTLYTKTLRTAKTSPLVLFFVRPSSGGVRHDPQRFMGKTVTVPHFNRDTVEFASRKRNESNPGIKTLLPFLKNITEERDFENFQDLIVALDACYWLHKTISRSLSRFGDERAI